MVLGDKSKRFAVRIIRFYRFLTAEKKEYILSKQILKSGTAIGANIAEATNAQSDKDFLSKISIALKECTETKYWLELLVETETIDRAQFDSLYTDCSEMEKLLTSAVKTSKSKIGTH